MIHCWMGNLWLMSDLDTWCFGFDDSSVLLLWLGFRAGLKLELGVSLKLEGSFPFLDWWCLVVQKRIENYERHKQHLGSPPRHQTHGWSTTIQTHGWISLYSFFGCWLLISSSLSLVNNVCGCFEIVGLLVKIGS